MGLKMDTKTTNNTEFRYIIRISNTDLDGNKQVLVSLRKIKGVSYSLANAICNVLNIDKTKKAGYLSDEEIEKINQFLKNPSSYNLPDWMLNLRKDPQTGKDMHLIESNIAMYYDTWLKNLRRIKHYKGVRLAKGLPVRGQRTKAHFRKKRRSFRTRK